MQPFCLIFSLHWRRDNKKLVWNRFNYLIEVAHHNHDSAMNAIKLAFLLQHETKIINKYNAHFSTDPPASPAMQVNNKTFTILLFNGLQVIRALQSNIYNSKLLWHNVAEHKENLPQDFMLPEAKTELCICS